MCLCFVYFDWKRLSISFYCYTESRQHCPVLAACINRIFWSFFICLCICSNSYGLNCNFLCSFPGLCSVLVLWLSSGGWFWQMEEMPLSWLLFLWKCFTAYRFSAQVCAMLTEWGKFQCYFCQLDSVSCSDFVCMASFLVCWKDVYKLYWNQRRHFLNKCNWY